jgi:hypothetical protein
MNFIRQESECLIDNGSGVINGFFDLLGFWLINLAGISIECRVRCQAVGCILPGAEARLNFRGFLKKRPDVVSLSRLQIPENQIPLQGLLGGLLAMVNCDVENRAIWYGERSGGGQIMQRLLEPAPN